MQQTWFEKLVGFREEAPDQVRANLVVDKSTITSKVNSRRMKYGRLEMPTLSKLRERVLGLDVATGSLSVSEVVADVGALHTRSEAEGAIFQVASQFNLLEMVSPSVTPESGVAQYANDLTQGPACAIAAGAGTIFRNYFLNVNGRIGQSADNQVDCLDSVGIALRNENGRLWSMQNGYVVLTEDSLQEIDRTLARMNEAERDAVRERLKIGVQWDTEITLNDCGHLVSQAFCSALPVAYSPHPPALWGRFARVILEATYEATLASALINFASTGNNRVYLTLVGGGAFGNEPDWILESIGRALSLFEYHPLDVRIVSYGYCNRALRSLI